MTVKNFQQAKSQLNAVTKENLRNVQIIKKLVHTSKKALSNYFIIYLSESNKCIHNSVKILDPLYLQI